MLAPQAVVLLCSVGLVLTAFVPVAQAAPAPTTPQIGNGYIATFVNHSDVFVAGVFNGMGSNSQRAPFRASTRLFVSEFAFSGPAANVLLELRSEDGLVQYVATSEQSSMTATHTWYAHRIFRHILVEEISIDNATTDQAVALTNFGSGSGGADDSSSGFDTATVVVMNFTTTISMPSAHLRDVVGDPKIDDGSDLRSADRVSVNFILYETLAAENTAWFGNITVCEVSTTAPSFLTPVGGSARLTVLTAYCTNAPLDGSYGADVCGCALDKLNQALSASVNGTLRSQHVAAWNELWNHRMLVVSSSSPPSASSGSSSSSLLDPSNLQKVIDGSMYGLLSSLHADVPYSTSPGGLPTNGYRGHTFWDMETWMFPNLALFYPDIARGSAVQYRLDRMRGAMENAATVVGGATGSAAFPWESAFSGYDVCPWPQGEHSELHVTADVVLGWRMLFYLHGDTKLLLDAFPLLNATSYFWLTRAVKDEATGVWNLNDVTPPDEYHFGNNSVYTNAAVKLAVNFTLEAARILNITLVPGYAAQLADLVENLIILYDPAPLNYHPEFAGYNGDSLVKQADVILLNFPMGFRPLEPSTAASDLMYYENRTDPGGPAMTWSMFAVGYLSLPNGTLTDATERGWYYFLRGFENNTYPPYYQWYEVAGGSGCPNFLTGAGGFLQSVWAGLLQLRVDGLGRLRILHSAKLPEEIHCATAQRLHFATAELTVSVCRAPDASYVASVLLEKQGSEIISAGGLPLVLGSVVEFSLTTNGDVVISSAALR